MKVTNINDYVDEVAQQFPEIDKSEIKRILVYGWKMILQYVSAGNDLQIIDKGFFFFIGKIPSSALAAFNRYCYKLAKRIQFMFKRTKSKWDGYYYFTRGEKQYADYLTQKRKTYKVFKDVFLYKLLDECKVANPNQPYIFRLKEDKTAWFRKYYKEIRTKNAELIIQRDPLNMESLMVSNNKYKYIQQ